jgi:hypothetical protein
MGEHPILFSGPMVRALLAGTKTQTRRIVDTDAKHESGLVNVRGKTFDLRIPHHVEAALARCPYGVPGDRLWVRERMRVMAWRCGAGVPEHVGIRYEADGAVADIKPWPTRLKVPDVGKCLAYGGPREGSRITLEIVSVRVERLQDITDEDIRAEGVTTRVVADLLNPKRPGEPHLLDMIAPKPRDQWALGWDAINGKRAPWSTNPWVWRVEFRRTEPHEVSRG